MKIKVQECFLPLQSARRALVHLLVVLSLAISPVWAAIEQDLGFPEGITLTPQSDWPTQPSNGAVNRIDEYGRTTGTWICYDYVLARGICGYTTILVGPPGPPPTPDSQWLCIEGIAVLELQVPLIDRQCFWATTPPFRAFTPTPEQLAQGQAHLLALENFYNPPPPPPPSGSTQEQQRDALASLDGIETISSCPNNSPSHPETPDPVDIFSGAFLLRDVDLSISCLISPVVSRQYDSAFAAKDGPFGMGSGLVPYSASVGVAKDATGAVITDPGTELTFSKGDHTRVKFVAMGNTLLFAALGKTGFADTTITVQVDAQNQMTGAILAKTNGDAFFFDAQGDLIRIQDRYDNTVAIIRNSDRRITRLEDPSTGKGINFAYDVNGHIVQAVGLAGQTVTYTYDASGRLITLTDPSGHNTQFAYDGQNRIVGVTDPRGVQTVQNTYDANGRVISQLHGDGGKIQLEYVDDSVRKVTDNNDHVREYRFDSHGLDTGFKTPLNQNYQTSYSPALFDNSGDTRTVTGTDPIGRTMLTELNQLNQSVKIIDAAGRVTEFTYEPTFNLLAAIKDPLGRITRFNYDAKGNVIEAIDADGNKSTFTYNAQGQVLTATNALGNKVQYQYDENHDPVNVTDPIGNTTTFAYDTLSRLIKTTDAKGNTTQYTYDILNRVTAITDALGHVTRFDYDENSNVLKVTDPRGNTTTATYDPMNRLTSSTNAKGETSTLAYDGVGNVITAQDPKGQTTTYTYDANDRLKHVQHGDGTTYSYDYDEVNRLEKIADGTANWNFAYDILDRLISENTPQGSLNYTYDVVSRLTGFNSPDTNYEPVQYAYDNLDRLTGITQNGKTYSYSYDPLSRRTGLSRPNGAVSTYEYDANSRLTALTHSQGTTVVERHDYGYDANGNITKYVRSKGTMKPIVTKPIGSGTIKQIVGYISDKAEEIERTYSYDPLDRLNQVYGIGIVASASQFKSSANRLAAVALMTLAKQTTNPQTRETYLRNAEKLGAVLPESASWSFDENGNIVQKSVRKPGGGQEDRSMTYDEADRLVEIARSGAIGNNPALVTLNYDANGNLVSDSTGRQFTWNALDQLSQLQTPTTTAQFGYDPLGRRTDFSRGALSRSYFYNGLDMLSDGISQVLHGAGIDEALQLDNSTNSLSYLQDHLGSSTQLLDALNGSKQVRYDYKSYGKLEGNIANPQPANAFTYTGREDDGTGLYYYRARYYDPELEVFISDDPMGNSQRFVGENPLKFLDPFGLQQVETPLNVPSSLPRLKPLLTSSFVLITEASAATVAGVITASGIAGYGFGTFVVSPWLNENGYPTPEYIFSHRAVVRQFDINEYNKHHISANGPKIKPPTPVTPDPRKNPGKPKPKPIKPIPQDPTPKTPDGPCPTFVPGYPFGPGFEPWPGRKPGNF